jgi:chloramphenicol O-acetyltransferase
MFVQTNGLMKCFLYFHVLSGDTPARYDLRLNVNLMQGAAQLKEKERHVEASLLYALTMTTEEIVAFYSERQKQLKAELISI